MADLRRRTVNLERTTADGFIEMRGKFAATAAGQQQIVALLNRVLDEQGDNAGGQQRTGEC